MRTRTISPACQAQPPPHGGRVGLHLPAYSYSIGSLRRGCYIPHGAVLRTVSSSRPNHTALHFSGMNHGAVRRRSLDVERSQTRCRMRPWDLAAVSLIFVCCASLKNHAMEASTTRQGLDRVAPGMRVVRHAFVAVLCHGSEGVALPKMCKHAWRGWGCFFQLQAKTASSVKAFEGLGLG